MKRYCWLIVFFIFAITIAYGLDDGPYLCWEEDKLISVKIIKGIAIYDTLSADPDGFYYLPESDADHRIRIESDYTQNKTCYEKPEEYLVISDIHGNYDGFVELLRNSGIIDSYNNWQYNGTLVIAGDVFDRGEQVTECMWLIYDLWQQSRESMKGNLVPVLGNHETMVLSTRPHKIKGKYAQVCELMGKTYNELYGNETVLGRWLRSWQGILILGDDIILHGGISHGTSQRYPTPKTINTALYDYYYNGKVMDDNLKYLMGRNGIFWYRGYFYEEEKWEASDPEIVQTILKQYGSNLIIVGHTTLDSISYLQNNQVIGIDAGLKYQESGYGLLQRKGSYYVLNSMGNIKELKK